ncbi:Fatty acyl-CoA reductase [compost metagenome]
MATPNIPEIVVITGATAGVGRATAQAFARRGAYIGLLARGREGLEATKREVEALGGRALMLPTDVADPEQVDAAAAAVEAEFGAIDVWINNAFTSVLSPFKDMSASDFKRVTDVCYLGYVYGTMAALRYMQPRDRGVIIQVGTPIAYRSVPLQSAYSGAKHAVVGFTDSLRSELLHDGSRVHVGMVHLPAINTAHFSWSRNQMGVKSRPVPPFVEPEEAANAIVWAVDHPRREVWLGTPTAQAILGGMLAPGLADLYLAWKGYDGQLTTEAEAADRPDNLWAPVEGDFGVRGELGDRTPEAGLPIWDQRHPVWGAAQTLGTAAGAIAGQGIRSLMVSFLPERGLFSPPTLRGKSPSPSRGEEAP